MSDDDQGDGAAPETLAPDSTTTAPGIAAAVEPPPVYLPIYVLTGCFGAIFIILPFLIRKGPNKEIIRLCIMMSAFFMWIFWVTVYIAQINPLMSPRMKNDTLVWIMNRNNKTTNTPSQENEEDDADVDES